jgi:hypothetical protein
MRNHSCNYCSYGIAQKEGAPSKKDLGKKKLLDQLSMFSVQTILGTRLPVD